MDIGPRIKLLREKRNLAQFELAAILKINNSTLSQYETGTRTPSDDMKIAIANYFDVSVDYLLGRDEKEKKPASDSTDGLDPELLELIKRIPNDRMPEVERYLRFQAEQREKP
ncbi:XRE family transcriptional regulator [Colidextribacter sp. OB.20]|uniref:helix-turn-helix domain-containing protein n=1 Tax=Colidextribacter sp. OB.20 TaxID=2304568 RepID=UPI00136B0DB1|nr:helix-turn-helix transcriptional regulator [Colidextribacter sp. OB.20]NBI08616.1 XRE family transcriptional regulator [Colidextribacter sp. OB.20]